MKILSTINILALLAQSFGLQQTIFDDRYGHVTPSCNGEKIKKTITLKELVSKTDTGPVSVQCGYRVIVEQGEKYDMWDG